CHEIFFICRLTRIFSRRYSVRIILVLNDVLRTTRPASPSHGSEPARKDAATLTIQPSEPCSPQSNRVQRPQTARAVFRLGAAESNGANSLIDEENHRDHPKHRAHLRYPRRKPSSDRKHSQSPH